MDAIFSVFTPIHREGHRFIAIFAVVTLLLFLVGFSILGWLGVIATIWCTFFFRDPDRVTPVREGLIISPADGLVQMIAEVAPPPELEMGQGPRLRISIFMNVFDVHVNRIPIDGEITKLVYIPGKFFNAELDKASEHNERQAVRLKTRGGRDIAFVQIAGLIARRIVCYLEEHQPVLAGERFGMIRFGSRVDVYLDQGTAPLVVVGQRAVAGETVLADLRADETARLGQVR